MEIIHTIHIKVLQNFKSEANTLNPSYIDIENDKPWTFPDRFRNKGYLNRFIIKSLLFSVSITNDTKTIFITL